MIKSDFEISVDKGPLQGLHKHDRRRKLRSSNTIVQSMKASAPEKYEERFS